MWNLKTGNKASPEKCVCDVSLALALVGVCECVYVGIEAKLSAGRESITVVLPTLHTSSTHFMLTGKAMFTAPPSPPLCCQSSASFRPTLPLLTHCVSLPCVSCRRAILILVLLLCWIEQSPLSPCLYSKALQVSCTSALFITHNQLLSAYLT